MKIGYAEYAAEKEGADYSCMMDEPEKGTSDTVSVAIVTATKLNGARVKVIFDTVAYICSDKGDTLEKVWAS